MASSEQSDIASDADLSAHWNQAYLSKGAQQLSWFTPHLNSSLDLLRTAGMNAQSALIDVGAGASTLVDDLLLAGLKHILVLDLSEHALALSRARVGASDQRVQWLHADIRTVALERGRYDLWHDRAVLHFLHSAEDLARYAAQARSALRRGGHAVIAGFGPEGPPSCSGLPVARRSADEIARLLGDDFELIGQRKELHRTPAARDQAFVYALLRRR